ncbi:acyl-CoA dehydrogenase family protein [Chloroflexota bacterium]
MDLKLKREQRLLKNMVREFAEKEVGPQLPALVEKDEKPVHIIKRMGELGLTGITWPKEYGGCNMGHVARVLALEELARVYPSLAGMLSRTQISPLVILRLGSEEQKKRFLPPVCRGEVYATWSVNEGGSGSDVRAMQATARLDGDSYILNGRKTFIGNAAWSDYTAVVAKTTEGFSVFVVEKGTQGFMVGRNERMITQETAKLAPLNEVTFTNCRIPRENLIGREGIGLGPILAGIGDAGRVAASAIALGIAEACLERAVKHAKEQHRYGKPLSKIESIRFMLGDMASQIEAARWLCYQAGWLLDQGLSGLQIAKETSIAKLFAVEMAIKVAYKAIEVHGAFGTTIEAGIVQRLGYVLDTIAAAGSNNTMRLVISNAVAEGR